jgi:hypothetical protein
METQEPVTDRGPGVSLANRRVSKIFTFHECNMRIVMTLSMSQDHMTKGTHEPEGSQRHMTAPLAARRPARNVRLRVAQDTNRAERIRQLKTAHPELTWSYIADQIGVRERSAIAWQKTGGISAKNAEKLAELFGVSYDFLWFGKEKGPTPDLLAGVSRIDQVDAVRDEFRGKVDKITAQLAAMEIDIESQNANLAQQTDLLERIQAAVTQQTALLADLTAGRGSASGASGDCADA